MAGQKVVSLHMGWAEVETSRGVDVLVLGGVSPGGHSLKVRVVMDDRGSIGYIGEALHEALKKREAELRQVRERLEGK